MAEILGGITVLGHVFNKRESKEHMENTANNIIANDSRFNRTTMGSNIYDNNQYKNNLNTMKSLSQKRSALSGMPEKTGVIPKGYNRTKNLSKRKLNIRKKENFSSDDDSIFSDQMSMASARSDVSDNDVNFFNPVHFL